MCGICGEWAPGGANPDRVARMSRVLRHRGPDDEGIEVMGRVALAARRLSVIDLETGHQPVRSADRGCCIAFNGEIYNYRELRRELASRGHTFRTRGDTEVVLRLYQEMGESVVDRLEGMFAFVIWDPDRRHLFIARDRFGQKPLFYLLDGDRFTFASEIKAILAGLGSLPAPDFSSLDDYLTLRFIPGPATMFEGIRKLPPGHTLTITEDDLARRSVPEPLRYWRLSYTPKLAVGEAEAIEETRRLLARAVESHLTADVPVGAFLSGGMDSSLVVAMMAGVMGPGVPTFTIGVEDRDFNELEFARQVATHCGTASCEEVVQPDLVRLLPEMVYHMEEPSDPVGACMYHAAALAARHLKVVLTGDGGDEVFAGFDRYAGLSWVKYYTLIPSAVRRWLFGPLIQSIPDRSGYKTIAQKARWLQTLSFHQGGRQYAEATAFFRFGHGDKAGLYTDTAAARLGTGDPTDVILRAFDAIDAEADLDRMLQADVHTRLPEHSLMLTDRMTMRYSLEARSPFLDRQLAEFVARLPSTLKIRRGRLKYILREASRPYLPQAILDRPKQGFMFPVGRWMHGPLADSLQRFPSRSRLVADGIFRREAIDRLVREHLGHRADHHVRLWMLLNAEIWYRLYQAGWSLDGSDGAMEEVLGTARVT